MSRADSPRDRRGKAGAGEAAACAGTAGYAIEASVNLKRRILLEYRKVYDETPQAPFLHARDALPARLGVPYEALAASVKELEQSRFLHWKAQDLYKLSPRGIRVTSDPAELDLEFPET